MVTKEQQQSGKAETIVLALCDHQSMVRRCQRPAVLHVGPGDVRLVHAPSPIASHPGIVVPVSVKSERYVIHSRQTAGFQGADPRGFNWDRKRQSIVGSRPAINHASDRSAGSGLDDNSDNGPKSDRLAPRGPGDDRRGLVISGDRQTARYECPAAARMIQMAAQSTTVGSTPGQRGRPGRWGWLAKISHERSIIYQYTAQVIPQIRPHNEARGTVDCRAK